MQLSELDWAYVRERAAYFTGRGWVISRLDQFFDGPPGVFLLLGEPGTGKTAVAAQLALATAAGSPRPPRRLRHAGPGRWPLPTSAARAGSTCSMPPSGCRTSSPRRSRGLRRRRATLVPEVHVGDVQVRTGDIAAGGSATGVRIDLSPLQPETAFVQAVTLPLRRVREAGESTGSSCWSMR
jgi:hypothetical protein